MATHDHPSARPSRGWKRRAGALLLGLLAACAGAPSPAAPLRVASDLDNAPFAFVDGQGLARGRDVEMMQELAMRLGRELVWVRMPFADLLPAVEAGSVDAVCATLGITPERAERVAFTRPYYRTAIAVVVRSGPGEPSRLDDLDGLRVSGAVGTTSERAVRQHLPNARPAAPTGKDRPTAELLLAGDLDAAAADGPAADAMVRASEGRLVRLAEDLEREDYAIVLTLGRDDLLGELDAALAELERSGWLAALDARYGL